MINIGIKSKKTYVIEVKDRYTLTLAWLEKQLTNYIKKFLKIKQGLKSLKIPTESIEYYFLIEKSPLSEYRGVKIMNPLEFMKTVLISEGSKEVILHDKKNTLLLSMFPYQIGDFMVNGRQMRITVVRVLKIDIDDDYRELNVEAFENQIVLPFIIDVPHQISMDELVEGDWIRCLLEDTMGGWVIYSLHDYKIIDFYSNFIAPIIDTYENES